VPGPVASVGAAAIVGLAVYTAVVLALRVPEAFQIQRLVVSRLRSLRAG
jgi:hypothetical protein